MNKQDEWSKLYKDVKIKEKSIPDYTQASDQTLPFYCMCLHLAFHITHAKSNATSPCSSCYVEEARRHPADSLLTWINSK